MSVVNQMLNDLEKREASNVGSHASYQAPEPKKKVLSPVMWVFLAVAAVLMAVLLFVDDPDPKVPVVRPAAGLLEATKSAVVRQSQDVESEVTETTPEAPQAETSVQVSPPETQPTADIKIEEKPVPIAEPEPVSTLSVTSSATRDQPGFQVLVTDAMARNSVTQAREILNQWIKAEPDNLAPRKKLAAIAFSGGQIAQAEQLLAQARSLAPEDPSIRLMQARLYKQTGDTSAAWKALQLNTEDGEFLHYRAAFAREIGDQDSAFNDYKALTETDQQDLRAWLGFAVVSEGLMRWPEARIAYENALALGSANPEINQFAQQRLSLIVAQSMEGP